MIQREIREGEVSVAELPLHEPLPSPNCFMGVEAKGRHENVTGPAW
ncbi:MAG: hypothetical protein AABZ47_01055 [Planctomycetota bacterium]